MWQRQISSWVISQGTINAVFQAVYIIFYLLCVHVGQNCVSSRWRLSLPVVDFSWIQVSCKLLWEETGSSALWRGWPTSQPRCTILQCCSQSWQLCQIYTIHENSHRAAPVTLAQHTRIAQTATWRLGIVNIPKKPRFKLSFTWQLVPWEVICNEMERKVFLYSTCCKLCTFLQPCPLKTKTGHISIMRWSRTSSGRSGAANWHQIATVWDSKLSGTEIIQSTEDVSKRTAMAGERQKHLAEGES